MARARGVRAAPCASLAAAAEVAERKLAAEQAKAAAERQKAEAAAIAKEEVARAREEAARRARAEGTEVIDNRPIAPLNALFRIPSKSYQIL